MPWGRCLLLDNVDAIVGKAGGGVGFCRERIEELEAMLFVYEPWM